MAGSFGIDDDADIRTALEWFQESVPNPAELQERIRTARAYLRERRAAADLIWPAPEELVLSSDVIASYLAQADALLNDFRGYDATLGALALPWIKGIGVGLESLKRMPGALDRVRRLLGSKQQHPDSGLYELVAAARYAHDGFEVEFIPESTTRTPDIRVGLPGITDIIHVECKRLRSSNYESLEAARVQTIFSRLAALTDERNASVWVEVTFTAELQIIPDSYLADRVLNCLQSPLALPAGYPWKDELAEGVVRPLSMEVLSADTRRNGPILIGPKMWRLLTEGTLQPGSCHFALRARSVPENPQYVDQVRMVTALSWQCLATASIEARARHVTSLLANIDRQVASAPVAIAHVGMYAERDTAAADQRRERNQAAVKRFKAASRLLQVNLHYYLPRIAEANAWTLDETVDWFGGMPTFVLDDPRLLALYDSDIESEAPAWHLPPPDVPGE